MSDARLLAIESLMNIAQRGRRPKKSMEENASSLDRRDRSFHMEIVYGVLRYRDTLDWILGHFLKNRSKLGDFTLNNLRMAVYQIFFMRVPDWAVVNESVEMEKGKSARESSGGKGPLVNAVLRNMLRQKEKFILPLQLDGAADSIAINTSHPRWLIDRWIGRYGEDEALMLARANNKVKPFSLRTNTLRSNRQQLIESMTAEGVSCTPARFSPEGIILQDMLSYSDLGSFHGLFSVQDEASQLITYLLDPKPDERVLDACAAPGGKTSHIAQCMQDAGEIIAVEKDPDRTLSLQDTLKTLAISSVKIVNADLTGLTASDIGTFDKILLDAPCSSIGVIRKNPDVKYRHTAADLSKNSTRQVGLLRRASGLLKDTGKLVYSVCSTEPEEGEQVITEFLKTATDFRIIDEVNYDFLRPFTEKGFFRTYPHRHAMDGFFGVTLCKNR